MKKIKITEYQYKRLREQSEEFNPDDLTSPEISISPRTHLQSAEKQYDYLISDEAIGESLMANEIEFDKDGNRA